MAEDRSSLSGVSDAEAKEFHALFVSSFMGFMVVAVLAHVLAWAWRPWIPGPKGWALLDSVSAVATSLIG
ncbi:light-harvesting complex 1 beta chain [Rhodoblastus acidophilus]|nr:light-harvesting antenna LH1, beta subunit [Rhodoblastus acidophilus]MCW2316032.1 light-harvesting complex 1 beta chain [Rhodoblastus acidophilus]PPQ38249.1 light-harvesting protein [Rhodoblastus acidophilus]RAI21776.1 light-harvesting protein [Rhodoblastus acidophilus]SNB78576.1 light-harvesting complex 1 beta chain [Rhodoblastus acidophilus]